MPVKQTTVSAPRQALRSRPASGWLVPAVTTFHECDHYMTMRQTGTLIRQVFVADAICARMKMVLAQGRPINVKHDACKICVMVKVEGGQKEQNRGIKF